MLLYVACSVVAVLSLMKLRIVSVLSVSALLKRIHVRSVIFWYREIRKQRRIKLPDAIVWASAQVNSLLLVSRNVKDFPADEPGVRVPYQV